MAAKPQPRLSERDFVRRDFLGKLRQHADIDATLAKPFVDLLHRRFRDLEADAGMGRGHAAINQSDERPRDRLLDRDADIAALGDLILDPFAGSGTTAVVAKKLGRDFVAIESDEEYCLLAAKRLEMAATDKSIQGFCDGVFWERNSRPLAP